MRIRRTAIFLVRKFLFSVVACGALVCFATDARRACAAPPATGNSAATDASLQSAGGLGLANLSQWKLDELHLKDGRVLPGLIQGEDAAGVDFLEIRRPADRPMFFVMFWRFPSDKIDHIARLSDADRKVLIDRSQRRSRSLSHRRGQPGEDSLRACGRWGDRRLALFKRFMANRRWQGMARAR